MQAHGVNPFLYVCQNCPTPCDHQSKLNYQFKTDLAFSEYFEQQIINRYQRHGFLAENTQQAGYPDIAVYHKNQHLIGFVEVKIQRRTFMTVQRLLPQADLCPSETVVLNLSDLIRYFKIAETTNMPLFIIWGVLSRPCFIPVHKIHYYYQDIKILKTIYQHYGDKRRFRRRSGKGDVVDGQHKGVVVNYHFSLIELIAGTPFLG